MTEFFRALQQHPQQPFEIQVRIPCHLYVDDNRNTLIHESVLGLTRYIIESMNKAGYKVPIMSAHRKPYRHVPTQIQFVLYENFDVDVSLSKTTLSEEEELEKNRQEGQKMIKLELFFGERLRNIHRNQRVRFLNF